MSDTTRDVVRHDRPVSGLRALSAAVRRRVPDSITVVTGVGSELAVEPPARQPVLPVLARRDRMFIGPIWRAGRPGCPQCLESRLHLARENPPALAALEQRHPGVWRGWQPPAVTALHATLAAELAHRLVERDADARERLPLYVLRLVDSGIRLAHLLPDPFCERCGVVPDDSPTATEALRPAPGLARAPGSLRTRSLVDDDAFLPTYVDRDCGLVRTLFKHDVGVFPTMSAPMGLRGSNDIEQGFGRTLSYRDAATAAVAEAVERWGGLVPSGHRTVVHAAREDLPDALDVRRLGLHDEERYDEPHFPFRRWRDDEPLEWVWGRSLTRDVPVLVPETYAYYRTHLVRPEQHRYLYEVSNGCAVGGSMVEAILHGLLEVIERDGFLMTWYARRPPATIDLSTAAGQTIPLLLERIHRLTGYRVHAFDTTTEHGIPSVWVAAIDEQVREGRPRFLCAAGAHFDMEEAVCSALLELAPMIMHHLNQDGSNHDRARQMVSDSDLCTDMHHHSELYARPEAQERLAFLYEGPRAPMAPPSALLARDRPTDLGALLESTVDLLRSHGLEVIAVDQTASEHRAGGLHCVKVIVPGMLPMTFGHRYRRTRGLSRLAAAVAAAGYDAVNPYPHPFP